MKRLFVLLLMVGACARKETHGAFDAATGIKHADAGGKAHISPLRPMTGDVEILSGDPDKAGQPFVIRVNELPGTKIPLHSHPVDENITVVQGTWYFAVADKWDRAALTPLRAGDYAFAPKGSKMFAWCPDGAIVQVHGVGPFHIDWLHGLQTLDNPGSTFTLRRGDAVDTPRGRGRIRQGYASGDIIQYEIGLENGTVVMVDQVDVRKL